MKNYFWKTFFLFSFLLLDFAIFAQGPGTNDEDGALEGDDIPQAPISGKLFWLALFGIVFAFYTYKKGRISRLSN